MRKTADILRYIQIVTLFPFGLVGLLIVPGQIEQIFVHSQWYPVDQHPDQHFQPYLAQRDSNLFAVYAISFGWALLIGLVAMQWLRFGWRIVIWAAVFAHNIFIFGTKDWPYQPGPTLIPTYVMILSGFTIIFEILSLSENQKARP